MAFYLRSRCKAKVSSTKTKTCRCSVIASWRRLRISPWWLCRNDSAVGSYRPSSTVDAMILYKAVSVRWLYRLAHVLHSTREWKHLSASLLRHRRHWRSFWHSLHRKVADVIRQFLHQNLRLEPLISFDAVADDDGVAWATVASTSYKKIFARCYHFIPSYCQPILHKTKNTCNCKVCMY